MNAHLRAVLSTIVLAACGAAHASAGSTATPVDQIILSVDADQPVTFTTPDGATVTQWAGQGLDANSPVTINNGDVLLASMNLSHAITVTASGFTSLGPQFQSANSEQFTVSGSVYLSLAGQIVATLDENSTETGFVLASDAYVPSGQTLTFDSVIATDSVTGLASPMTLTGATLSLYQAAAVPEASTSALFGLGLCLMAARARGRRQSD